MSRSSLLRSVLLSWGLLCAVVLWDNRDLLREARYEQSDDAANALSIDKAKHGREIYGNYSRFNFRHPGPAFAYVYAAGEGILEDALGVVSPRQNAHQLTSILLQAAFLALAIGLAASHTPSPGKAACLLAGLALAHFAFVQGAFSETWPPLALMMPFAAFVVAAASVCTGRTEDAVWLALCGAFLLHGHVAQPLFVGGLVLAVMAVLAARRLRGIQVRGLTATRWAALGVFAALTALPWVLDACRGRESNLFNIWQHIRQSSGDPLRPGWAASVAYTLSYFCYCPNQDPWFAPGAAGTLGSFARANLPGIVAAGSGLAAAGVAVWSARARTDAGSVFVRWLAGLCALAACLAVVWARRQDGGLTFFNSLFLFGLMGVVWWIPFLGLADRLRVPGLACALALLGCLLCVQPVDYGRAPAYMEPNGLGREAEAKVARWLAQGAHPQRAKLLVFEHDDWDAAVTVAAALNRRGVRAYVPGSDYGIWTHMFGEDHVLQTLEEAHAVGPFDWWRPARPRRAGQWLADEPESGIAPRPRAFPVTLDLQDPGDVLGLSGPEPGIRWTESRVVLMRLWTEPAPSDVRIRIDASALPLERGESQRVQLLVNGTRLKGLTVTGRAVYSFVVPRAVWNQGASPGRVDLAWGLPDSARLSAQPHAVEKDGRLLGICLHSVVFESVGALR